MADQKMIQRCQLSSAANCFLNSRRVQNDDEPVPRDRPTAPYFAGQNWKSAMSAATELDERRKIMTREYQRVRAQMAHSINRIDLCHKEAEKVKPERKEKELVKRGSTRALSVPAHLQTPFVLNPTPNRFCKRFHRRFENSHLSEHTGRLGLPLYHYYRNRGRSSVYLRIQRIDFGTNEREDPRFPAEYYNECMSEYNFQNPDSPGGNGILFNSMYLFLWDSIPTTIEETEDKILNGTEEEKKDAKIRLSEMEKTYQREHLKRKLIIKAEINATKAQDMATRLVGFKTNSFRETISQFEYIKERGGEGYLKIKHHLSAVPEYVAHEFQHERQMGTGLWNAIGPGNGVKRGRPGSVWRDHDPHGMHSSLRMVSNASSGFQEKYVTKAIYGPPTSIHPVDDLPEPLEEESDSEETDSSSSDSSSSESVSSESDDDELEEDY